MFLIELRFNRQIKLKDDMINKTHFQVQKRHSIQIGKFNKLVSLLRLTLVLYFRFHLPILEFQLFLINRYIIVKIQ